MSRTFYAVVLLLLVHTAAYASDAGVEAQRQKEAALATALKGLVTCKTMTQLEEGNVYCSLSFRGLQLEFAGVNSKSGGTIYVTALGKNQTLSARGSKCLEIAFGDEDIKGHIDAHIIFRNDGSITHSMNNKKARAGCE